MAEQAKKKVTVKKLRSDRYEERKDGKVAALPFPRSKNRRAIQNAASMNKSLREASPGHYQTGPVTQYDQATKARNSYKGMEAALEKAFAEGRARRKK